MCSMSGDDDDTERLPMISSTNGNLGSQSPPSSAPSLLRTHFPLLVALVGAGALIGAALSGYAKGYRSKDFDRQKGAAGQDTTAKAVVDVVNDPDPDAPWPRVAWLLSFPNSGTSFTGRLMRSVTNLRSGSNYGKSNVDKNGESVPIFKEWTDGPFWTDPADERRDSPKNAYVLTKTHCGGYCERCGPDKYMLTQHQFRMSCLSGDRAYRDESGKLVEEEIRYDAEKVHRAVHLIRNPFDNIVSRFHLAHHQMEHSNNEKELAKYPSTKEGFRSFCSDLNEDYASKEKQSIFVEDKIMRRVKDVPCHADFLRYIHWHNHAFTMTKNLRLPTMVLHYENFDTKFDETLSELLIFLKLEMVGEPAEFVRGKEYVEYFTSKEVKAVKNMMKEMAYADTWENLKHYFE